jgi:hypothetical protein
LGKERPLHRFLTIVGVLAAFGAEAQETAISFRAEMSPELQSFVATEMPRAAPALPWAELLARGRVRIGSHDFDGDGTPERLVMADAPEHCSVFGCATVLMWGHRGAWRAILTRRMDADAVRAAAPATRFASYGLRHGDFTASFNLVDGEPVEFWTAAGEERAWAVQTVIEDYIERDSLLNAHREELERANIKLADIDLSDSEFSERIVMVDHPAWCTPAGCASLVLQWWNDDWRVVLRGGATAEGDTFALSDRRYGWRRLRTPESIYSFKDGDGIEAEDVATGRERGIFARTDTK